jgi:putative hemolysin
MDSIEKTIDIEKAIRSGNNKFLKSMPGFIILCMKRLIHEDEMNATIYRSRHLDGVPFVRDVLVGWNVKVRLDGIDNLPSSGRYIFASNHPVGGIDALAFFDAIGGLFPDIISPANEILHNIPNMRPLIFGLNVFGKASRETAAGLHDLFDSDRQIFIFPAGEVSRRNKGKISDNVWQKSFISKSVEHKRDVVPVHISGRNSNLFYNVAGLRKSLGIKMYIETILLPREMMRQMNSTVTITVGKPISWRTFIDGISHLEWAQKVKSLVYSLPENKL